MKLQIGDLVLSFETYYEDNDHDIDYESDTFDVIDRRWFDVFVFFCGGHIYCDDLINFATVESKNHFIWLLSKFYPKLIVVKFFTSDGISERLKVNHAQT